MWFSSSFEGHSPYPGVLCFILWFLRFPEHAWFFINTLVLGTHQLSKIGKLNSDPRKKEKLGRMRRADFPSSSALSYWNSPVWSSCRWWKAKPRKPRWRRRWCEACTVRKTGSCRGSTPGCGSVWGSGWGCAWAWALAWGCSCTRTRPPPGTSSDGSSEGHWRVSLLWAAGFGLR